MSYSVRCRVYMSSAPKVAYLCLINSGNLDRNAGNTSSWSRTFNVVWLG